ncbi:MAG: thymidylate synthase [Candidatus Woesearchaeota archaeon]
MGSQYIEFLSEALSGQKRLEERTGTGTIGRFGQMKRWNIGEGDFPASGVRPAAVQGVIGETISFLHGDTNVRDFLNRKCRFWTGDAMRHNKDALLESGLISEDEITYAKGKAKQASDLIINGKAPFEERCIEAGDLLKDKYALESRYEKAILNDSNFAEMCGDLGPVYGAIWNGNYKDAVMSQIEDVEKALRAGGSSRRMIFSGWHPDKMHEQALPPCHLLYHFNVSPETKKLDLLMYQRSDDLILGHLHNQLQSGLILALMAKTHDFEVGEFIHSVGDYHVYLPHVPLAQKLVERGEPVDNKPRLEIKVKKDSITDYDIDDIVPLKETGYKPYPSENYRIPMFGGLI